MYRQSASRNSSFSGSASKITFICSSEGLRRIIPYYSGNIGYRIHIHFNQFLCFIHTKLLYIFGKVLFKGLFEKTGKVNFRYTEAVCHGYQGQLRTVSYTHLDVYKRQDVLFSVMLGCPADNVEELPPMLSGKTLSSGRYAVFTHRGTLANLFKTYKYIFGTWLSAAEEELDDREDFEVYEREVTAFDDPDNEVKIYIPIK